jgi:hypothetical protein
MDGVDNDIQGFPFSAVCSIPFPILLAQVNQPISPVASKCYHMVISTNIHVNRTTQLEDNIEMYATEENTQFNGKCFHFMARNRHSC